MADKQFPLGDGQSKQRFEDLGDDTHAPVVWAIKGAVATDGTALDVDSLAQALNYNVDGTLNYISVTFNGSEYRQTMTYTSGKLTGVSAWVKQ